MTQITTGLRSFLSSPALYRLSQELMGAHAGRTSFVRRYVRIGAGANLLDVGCGPADIVEYLPPGVNYWGFDISDRYIASARARYPHPERFIARPFTRSELVSLPRFDVVVASGLFHHLDDPTAEQLLSVIQQALKPGGRLVTVDPVFVAGQNRLARWLISKDRGQHVRTEQQYRTLFSKVFPSVQLEIRHQSWVPYTHCLSECIQS